MVTKPKLYDATRGQLASRGLTGKDAEKLVRALCTLVDYEGAITAALAEVGGIGAHAEVCRALRLICDGAA